MLFGYELKVVGFKEELRLTAIHDRQDERAQLESSLSIVGQMLAGEKCSHLVSPLTHQ